MAQSVEQRLAVLEKLIAPYAQRQQDIAHTEWKILEVVRQLARLRCGYYVDEKGARILCRDQSVVKGFQMELESRISLLSVDLMGTDKP